MNQPARKRRGPITLLCDNRRVRWAVIAAVVLLPVLYVASIGPAVWLDHRGVFSPTWRMRMDRFYSPLVDGPEIISEPTYRYMQIWVPETWPNGDRV